MEGQLRRQIIKTGPVKDICGRKNNSFMSKHQGCDDRVAFLDEFILNRNLMILP